MTRRAVLQTVPFHEVILDEMNSIFSETKDARGKAVQCARLIRRTKIPHKRGEIRKSLEGLFEHLLTRKKPTLRLSTSDKAEFNGAFEALDIQDAADVAAQSVSHSGRGLQVGVSG